MAVSDRRFVDVPALALVLMAVGFGTTDAFNDIYELNEGNDARQWVVIC